jgi:hypothetical protein
MYSSPGMTHLAHFFVEEEGFRTIETGERVPSVCDVREKQPQLRFSFFFAEKIEI